MTTREVSREKLPEIQALDELGFADWLSLGFLEYAANPGNLMPFGEAWAFTGRRGRGDITDDIADVHNVLLPAEQSLFRRGLARALAQLDIGGTHGVYTARKLLQLAEKISAIETLPVLSQKFFNASWLATAASGRELLAAAADVAIDLAHQSERSYAALQDLIVSPAFQIQRGAARKALLALCKAAPDDLDVHLQLLAQSLHWMFVERETTPQRSLADERAKLFLEVARLVRPRVLMHTIKRYNNDNREDPLFSRLSWWGDTLIEEGLSSHYADEIKELTRRLQLLPPEPIKAAHPAEPGWDPGIWQFLSTVAFADTVPTDQIRSQLSRREPMYGASIEVIMAESVCRDSFNGAGQ